MHLPSIIHLLITYRYGMLAVLSLLEGSIVCLLAGFLAHAGYFSFLPAFIIIIIGDLIPNSIFFFIGRFGNNRALTRTILNKLQITERHLELLEHFWVSHTWKTMFLSKMAWSMGLPFFTSAGMTRLSFVRYISVMTVVAVFQYGIIFAIGYAIGHSYASLTTYHAALNLFGIICTILIVLGIFVLLPRYAKKKLLE